MNTTQTNSRSPAETTHKYIAWFSGPQESLENAQEWYIFEMFKPAAVFELPEGGFVMAYIREMETPPKKTAQALERLVDYKMRSYHDSLLDIWHRWER